MKKSLLLFSFAILLFACCMQAQNVTKKASLKKLHPAFSEGIDNLFMTYNPGSSYTFKFDEQEAYQVHISGITISMNKVRVGDEKPPKKTKVETPKYKDKKVVTREVVSFGREVYLIAEHRDKKTDQVTLLAYKVDLKKFSLSPTAKILDTYTDLKGVEYSYKYTDIKKQSLLITRNEKNRRIESAKLFYMMFDSEMNKSWEHEVKPPISNKEYIVEDFYFKDEDNLLLICVEYPDGKRESRRKGAPNYTYHLFFYSNKMETVKDYVLDLNGKFITDISAEINDNGQIVCAGFYSNKKGFYYMSGCFYMAINGETKKVEKTSTREFDNAFALSLMEGRQKRKEKRKADVGEHIDAPDFDLRKLYFDTKGNILLIAEMYYRLEHTSTSTRNGVTSTRTWYTYHYEDMIVVSINKSGDIAWNIKIDKKLVFDAPVDESFITFDEGGKWVFIYNENLKNMKEGDDDDDYNDVSAGRKNSAPVMVVLDENGKYTKEILMKPEGKKSIVVEHDFHLVMPDGEHIVKITDNDGSNYYRLGLKL